MSKREHGVTVVELMFVVASVAVGGALVVPSLGSTTSSANEATAIATLKKVVAAQKCCRGSVGIDVDGDNEGEFGFFAELAGTEPVRNSSGYYRRISPPVLSKAFGFVRNSWLTIAGYHFQMFLPDPMGAGVAEDWYGGDWDNGQGVDPTAAEQWWSCYAWPVAHGRTGERTFFVDQSGEILATKGGVFAYSGWWSPNPSAAFVANSSGFMGNALAANTSGWDGNFWYVVE